MASKKLWLERIDVESYSGYKLHEHPVAFCYKGERHLIQEITDRWYEGGRTPAAPIVNYFKVLTDDGKTHLLRYDTFHDEWTVVTPRPGIG